MTALISESGEHRDRPVDVTVLYSFGELVSWVKIGIQKRVFGCVLIIII